MATKKKRLTILAGYDRQGKIDPYVMELIRQLEKYSDKVVAVFDFSVGSDVLKMLSPKTLGVFIEHKAYDFGSWKHGLEIVGDEIKKYDELLLINDSCFPVGDIGKIFKKAEKTNQEWYGIFEVCHNGYRPYNVSFFQLLTKPVFTDPRFLNWFSKVVPQKSVKEVVHKYEVGLTTLLRSMGARYRSYVPKLFFRDPVTGKDAVANAEKYDVPLIKKRLFVDNLQGVSRLWVKARSIEEKMKEKYISDHVWRIFGEYPRHWFLPWSGFSTPLWLRVLFQVKGSYTKNQKWFRIRFKLFGMTIFLVPIPMLIKRFKGRR